MGACASIRFSRIVYFRIGCYVLWHFIVVFDHLHYYEHYRDQDQDGDCNVANGVAPLARLLHLGVAVEAHSANDELAIVAR